LTCVAKSKKGTKEILDGILRPVQALSIRNLEDKNNRLLKKRIKYGAKEH
jgi:hypothetical protein